MRTLQRILILLLVSIPTFFISNCEKDDDVGYIDDSGLAENTVIIEKSDWQDNIISVDTASYTFKFDKNILAKNPLSKGDIIVGTVDGGFLRKVKDLKANGDEVTITTEFAAITEAFKELHEQNSATLIPNLGSDEFWLGDGVALNTKKGTAAKLIDFSINAILYDLDNNKATKTDQIRISGNYTMDASFSVDVDIEDFEIQNLMLQYEINQNKVINGYMGIGGLEYSDKARLAVIPCGVIPAGPIIIEPVITLWAGFAVNLSAPIQLNSEQRYSSLTTITYQTGDWKTEKSITEDEIFEPPSVSGILSAKLYIKPELKFKVYRTVSPYINAELYGAAKVELESDLLKWKTSIGLGMNAGVKMEIWKSSLFDFSANLFDWEHVIAQGEEPAPANIANTTWDFLCIHDEDISWHADVTFNADGTAKYDEPDSPGTYLTYGTWSVSGNILSYDMDSDSEDPYYQFTGVISGNTMEGTYTWGPHPAKTWSAIKRQ